MLQLIVLDINNVFNQISNIKGFDIKYEPIKSEPRGENHLFMETFKGDFLYY